jgi:hypothetical protein
MRARPSNREPTGNPRVTSERVQRVRIAREALRLRESVLRYLRAGDPTRAGEPLFAASPEVWTFLLRV